MITSCTLCVAWKGDTLARKRREDFEYDVQLDVEARVRESVKAVLEKDLQEEMTEQFRGLLPRVHT
jgi:hypothetical protein